MTIGRDGKPLIITNVPGVSAVTSITSSSPPPISSAAAGLSPQPSPSNCQHRHQEIRVTERQGRRQQSGPHHHPDSQERGGCRLSRRIAAGSFTAGKRVIEDRE